MTVSVIHQTYVFVLNFAIGALCGVVFDAFRTRRRFCAPSRMAAALQDTLFFFLCAAAMLLCAYFFCGGELRFFQVAAASLGAGAYLFTLSAFVRRAMENTARLLRKIIVFLLRLAFIPVYILYRALSPAALLAARILRKIVFKVKNFAKKHLRTLKKAKKRAKML